MTDVHHRLERRSLVLPVPNPPVANYVGFVRSGNLVHVSGQLSLDESGGIKGTVGYDVDIPTGQRAAYLCGVNLLAQFQIACEGDLNRVTRVIKLGGFVQAAANFTDIPQVINGCSDLMVDILGDKGRHSRSAVGVYRLPLGFAVEVDAIFEIAD